jgi:hypothetical protein
LGLAHHQSVNKQASNSESDHIKNYAKDGRRPWADRYHAESNHSFGGVLFHLRLTLVIAPFANAKKEKSARRSESQKQKLVR